MIILSVVEKWLTLISTQVSTSLNLTINPDNQPDIYCAVISIVGFRLILNRACTDLAVFAKQSCSEAVNA